MDKRRCIKCTPRKRWRSTNDHHSTLHIPSLWCHSEPDVLGERMLIIHGNSECPYLSCNYSSIFVNNPREETGLWTYSLSQLVLENNGPFGATKAFLRSINGSDVPFWTCSNFRGVFDPFNVRIFIIPIGLVLIRQLGIHYWTTSLMGETAFDSNLSIGYGTHLWRFSM